MLVGLDVFINRTRLGRGVRAVAQNPDVAALMGVNKDRVIMLIFILGGAMAGAASVLYDIKVGLTTYSVGFLIGIKAFTAAVLGGIGNLRGALLGGLLLGVVENYGAGVFGNAVDGRGRLHHAGRGAAVPSDRAAGRIAGEGPGMSALMESLRRADEGRAACDDRAAAAVVGAAGPWRIGALGAFIVLLYSLPGLELPLIKTPDTDFTRCCSSARSTSWWRSGLNVVIGLAGLLDLGYIGFYAVGAYTVAILGSPNSPVVVKYPWVVCIPIAHRGDDALRAHSGLADAAAAR